MGKFSNDLKRANEECVNDNARIEEYKKVLNSFSGEGDEEDREYYEMLLKEMNRLQEKYHLREIEGADLQDLDDLINQIIRSNSKE